MNKNSDLMNKNSDLMIDYSNPMSHTDTIQIPVYLTPGQLDAIISYLRGDTDTSRLSTNAPIPRPETLEPHA